MPLQRELYADWAALQPGQAEEEASHQHAQTSEPVQVPHDGTLARDRTTSTTIQLLEAITGQITRLQNLVRVIEEQEVRVAMYPVHGASDLLLAMRGSREAAERQAETLRRTRGLIIERIMGRVREAIIVRAMRLRDRSRRLQATLNRLAGHDVSTDMMIMRAAGDDSRRRRGYR